MKIKIVELGTFATDSATDIKGMVTHFNIGLTGAHQYIFQPPGLSPETKHPVKCIWVAESRLQRAAMTVVDLPTEVLGTEVKDKASPFCGMAVGVTLHINGCVHIEVQPKGTLEKTGAPIDVYEIDIRRLEGKAITPMTREEQRKDERDHPSPAPIPRRPHS